MRKSILGVVCACLAIISFNISAAIVQIDSSTSIIHTSGGLFGSGYGDLSISGSFNVTEVGGSLLFEDIDVVVSPDIYNISSASLPLPVDVKFDGFNITTTPFYCVFVVGVYCPTDNIIGSFDGASFVMNRFFSSNIPDDYSYDIQIVGAVSAVPIPTAAWLFGSGLLGLIGVARRKKS